MRYISATLLRTINPSLWCWRTTQTNSETMKLKSMIAALLLMVAGLQTAWAQGFRVYKSDGTVAQFSFRTDSIVFYDGIGTDEDFGPFTPVNQCIVGTWYKPTNETITFNEDGTTDYIEGATYKFFPYQGNIGFYNASGAPVSYLKVLEVTAEKMVVSSLGSSSFDVLIRTQPVQLVTSIVLNETSISLLPDETKVLTARVLPEDANNKDVIWESSNESVATVDQTGKVTAVASGSCTITATATDGSGVKAACEVTVVAPDTHEYVDLGLPSGTLWATCNIGASSPEECGDYFAWGETEPKEDYTWATYKYCNGSGNTMTKYCTKSNYGYNGYTDSLLELLPEDDAATINWGSGWQTPSITQCSELYNSNYTTKTWTMQNGVKGLKVTSKSNGNSIFLPATGYRTGTRLNDFGSNGDYWSRSLDTGDISWAYDMDGSSVGSCPNGYYRYSGQVVRPVRKQ